MCLAEGDGIQSGDQSRRGLQHRCAFVIEQQSMFDDFSPFCISALTFLVPILQGPSQYKYNVLEASPLYEMAALADRWDIVIGLLNANVTFPLLPSVILPCFVCNISLMLNSGLLLQPSIPCLAVATRDLKIIETIAGEDYRGFLGVPLPTVSNAVLVLFTGCLTIDCRCCSAAPQVLHPRAESPR
jgi:hypothetical protein